ncbi:hypothetical protein DBR33_10565 [Stenotrophomonas sp. HMWF022]|nr:hypothetical protein DBR20_15480 [Stenotrophomonas sp. HMWF023]PTT43378.1 hypothetical protein DBR33_10565 [Stenotrophomonas sp. HMWF022]
MPSAKYSPAFVCVHEHVPDSSKELDQIFKYARWMQDSNLLNQDSGVNAEIERLYRIAAENGHAKANINLQNGSVQGRYALRGEESLRLSKKLIDDGVATGYFFIAAYLRGGLSGLQQDQDAALVYFRKAADEGSANAQYYLGTRLEPSGAAPEVAMQMYLCAAEQGNGDAAVALGVYRRRYGRYEESFHAFQLGVRAGSASAASFLGHAFRAKGPEDELFYLGQTEDVERSDRYVRVWRTLANYSYATPRALEVNDILPPPPAILPPWSGKLKWLVEREAEVPPPKPSETQITEFAKAQMLDPATGKLIKHRTHTER